MRLTYARVVSTLAALLALAGGATAAVHVAAKSVGPKQLRTAAVTARKLHGNSVASPAVKNHSLTVADVRPADILSSVGFQGLPGAKGATGDPSTQLAEISYRGARSITIAAGGEALGQANCSTAYRAVAAGAKITGAENGEAGVLEQHTEGTTASADFFNSSATSQTATVSVICIRVPTG